MPLGPTSRESPCANILTAADLAKFEPRRRYATLVSLIVDTTATVIDEIVNLHDQIIGRLFNRAKHQHHQQFQESGKAINDKVRLYGKVGRALLEARESGTDAFAAIESVIPWEAFIASVAEAQKLVQGDAASLMLRKLGSYLSPLGWEHINLTGDYVWRQNRPRSPGKFRPLRVPPRA